MVEISSEIILLIVSIVLSLLTVYSGEKYLKGKKVIHKIAKAFKTLDDGLEDDKISEEEWDNTYNDFKDIIDEAKK